MLKEVSIIENSIKNEIALALFDRRFSDFRDPFDADSTQIRIGFDAKSLG